jgi:hypothetical protein
MEVYIVLKLYRSYFKKKTLQIFMQFSLMSQSVAVQSQMAIKKYKRINSHYSTTKCCLTPPQDINKPDAIIQATGRTPVYKTRAI